MVAFSDQEISELILEPKVVSAEDWNGIRWDESRGHREAALNVRGDDGSEFKVILRQSRHWDIDFSAILAVNRRDISGLFLLKRYNGASHEHTNPLEGEKFEDFHIHTATERYQEYDPDRPEKYAQPTERYDTLSGAIRCLRSDCGFVMSTASQLAIFEELGGSE